MQCIRRPRRSARCDRLGIPFYALDLQSDFSRIVDYFVDEYTHGRTPNPCVQCNNWIKFGRLFDYADSVDAEFVATGHYAQMVEADDGPALAPRSRFHKDQSYALAGIDRRYLKRMLLPVGKFLKPEIRRMAGEAGLKVADKRDSQEICFVASGKHAQFVRARSAAATAGDIVTVEGRKVGSHAGIEAFTIGQRKGIGVAMKEPYFVVRIDAKTNAVVIGTKDDLARSSLSAVDANWLIEPPRDAFRGSAQIRYNSEAVPALITPTERVLRCSLTNLRTALPPASSVWSTPTTACSAAPGLTPNIPASPRYRTASLIHLFIAMVLHSESLQDPWHNGTRDR